MNEMQKFKLGMARDFAMTLLGCFLFGVFMMLLLGLYGHVTEDFARRDWAFSWAWTLVKSTFAYMVLMIVVLATARTWIAKKR